MKKILFAHGKESGPRGGKILALAKVGQGRGWSVESIDFRSTIDPDRRLEMLLEREKEEEADTLVLAGSSMGGYVVTCASSALRPSGLFLMAPALYLPGYADADPVPMAGEVEIVHGWEDEVVPANHSIRFARRHRACLHLVKDGHRLAGSLPFLERVFGDFLDRISAGAEA